MGFLKTVLERRASPERPSTNLSNPSAWLVDWAGGGPTKAGVAVSETKALGISAVYACIRAISETVASLPLFVYERLEGGGKRPATEHPLHQVLHTEPNQWMTSFTWRETSQAHVTAWGNAYSEIVEAGGRVELHPLLPDRTDPVFTGSGRLFYATEDTEDPGREPRMIPAEAVVHVPGLGFDGIKGYSPIQLHRENLGLSLALVANGGSFFGQGSRPSGMIEHPLTLDDEGIAQLRRKWELQHSGIDNMHKVAVLDEGMKWRQVTIPPEDAQYLETRELQVNEIARIFRCPPHKIQHLKQATFSNIEMQAIEWVTDTILPWLIRWEQELTRKLLSTADRRRYFVEHKVDGLLRGDIETRYKAYSVGRQWGWLNANDVRELENMNPLEGPAGEAYLAPMNMIPADQLGQPIEPAPAPADKRTERRAEHRAVRLRQRLVASQSKVIYRAARELVDAEVADIREAGVARHLKSEERSATSFKGWLEEFFASTTNRTLRMLEPAFLTFAEEMAAVASDEVNATPADLRRFAREYVNSFAVRHADSQLGQLLALIRDTDIAELAAVIEARLSEWQDKSPAKIARNESVRAGSAFAKAAWVAAGLSVIRWVTVGENCPLCRALDGRVVSIRGYFARPGDTIDPGTVSPLNVEKSIGHPPLHRGCDCTIAP
jgi:HK97 family phage portal protein